MSSSSSLAFLSLAQTLPPEVLDQIFSIHFSRKHRGADRTGKGLSLICRNWSGPVQRLLLQSVTVKSVVKLHELGRVKMTLGEVVKSLTVEVIDKGNKWKIRELNDVLDTLPRLTSLTLYLNSSSPGYQGSYAALKRLPNLVELSLRSSEYDSNMVSYRQILGATPNICSLTLSTDDSGYFSFNYKKRAFIDLPSLDYLSLQGPHLCRTFDQVNLLSEVTLDQITSFELGERSPRNFRLHNLSSINLMRKIGKKLKILTVGSGKGNYADATLISTCPSLETLIISRRLSYFNTPETLSTIIYQPIFPKEACEWLVSIDEPVVSDWANVKRVEIDGGQPSVTMKTFMVAKGIELILDGAVYYPPSLSA